VAGAQKRTFFTIGYEGLGIKRFLEILQENGVKTFWMQGTILFL
jgi:hypothetical protein